MTVKSYDEMEAFIERCNNILDGDLITYLFEEKEMRGISNGKGITYGCKFEEYEITLKNGKNVRIKDIVSITPSSDCGNILLARDIDKDTQYIIIAYLGKIEKECQVGDCIYFEGCANRLFEIEKFIDYRKALTLQYEKLHIALLFKKIRLRSNVELTFDVMYLENRIHSLNKTIQKMDIAIQQIFKDISNANTNINKVRESNDISSRRIEYEHTHDHSGNLYGSTLANPVTESFEKWLSR